ncbi:hypothetical protein HK097_003262 [Rhizophlyctis rosea]|uniref:Bacteriophage/plasmid primase P4 C-terminal domain-containing protein n=1 Tax=Rhizophlyctis rosea TaxID=64517 RepID=A0AAD5S3P3_9FUNG|nr:hypothetical protein HK097_003262 [Rhizophlyctis rosea]
MDEYFPIDTKKQRTVLTLIEYADESRLNVLIKSLQADSNLKATLKAYMKNKVAPNQFKVDYRYSKHAYLQSGRLYARNQCGLQSFPKWVRSFISGAYYVDVDSVSSTPNILKHELEKRSIKDETLERFLEHKMSFLQEHKLDKTGFITILMDGKNRPKVEALASMWDKIYHRLVPEMKKEDYWSDLWNHCSKSKNTKIKSNPDGSFFALCMQTLENRILKAQKHCLKETTDMEGMPMFAVDSLQFDGMLVRKNPVYKLDERRLTKCTETVNEVLNYNIPLAVKPFVDYEPELQKLNIASKTPKVPETLTDPYEILLWSKVSHMDVAKMLPVKSDGCIVYDGIDFWAFQNKWNVVAVEHIKRELHDKINVDVENRMKDLGKDEREHFEKLLESLKNNKFVNDTIGIFKTLVFDATFEKRLDTDYLFLGCNNGYIDLKTGKLYPHRKDVLISKSVGFDYFDKSNKFDTKLDTEWHENVKRTFPVKDERNIVKTYMGYCLRGDHPEKIFAICKDKQDGNNVKSKFVQACAGAIGTYAKDGQPNHIYKSKGPRSQSGHNSHIFAYEKSRLAVFEELDNEELDVKLQKLKTSGNGKISGRRSGAKMDETVEAYCKDIWIFNDKCQPVYDTSDSAFLGRMLCLPFRSKFYKTQDELDVSEIEHKFLASGNMDDKMLQWRPYILKWMIDGHMLYMKNRFTQIPNECKKWLEETNKDVDNIGDWVQDNLEKTGHSENYVTLKQIKGRMPKSMEQRFKSNEHMLNRLDEYLGKHVKDTVRNNVRLTNVWIGWRMDGILD